MDNANLIIILVTLGPIAIVIFPVIYQNISAYNINEKPIAIPQWKRYTFSVIGTSIILGIFLYLFMIISFTLFYSF